jgi:hypothetical protein
MSLTVRVTVAAMLLLLAAYLASRSENTSDPLPEGHLSLAGCFVGPDAAEDAAIVAALAWEIADEIEHDGQQDEPALTSGVAFDELRTRARVLRCRGESLGAKYPTLRDKVQSFLEGRVGVSGGPVTDRQRDEWVRAYREISRAAAHVVQ